MHQRIIPGRYHHQLINKAATADAKEAKRDFSRIFPKGGIFAMYRSGLFVGHKPIPKLSESPQKDS